MFALKPGGGGTGPVLLAGEARLAEADKVIEQGLQIDPGSRQLQALREQTHSQPRR